MSIKQSELADLIAYREVLKVINNNSQFKVLCTEFSPCNVAIVQKHATQIDDFLTACQLENYSECEHLYKYKTLLHGLKYSNPKSDKIEKKIRNKFICYIHKSTICCAHVKNNDYYYSMKEIYTLSRDFLYICAHLFENYSLEKYKIKSILLFINPQRFQGNIYLPEDEVIYRGVFLDDTFVTSISKII